MQISCHEKIELYFTETKDGEMLRYVTKELAQKIVCRTMEIIDCNINVMNEKESLLVRVTKIELTIFMKER